MTHSNFCKSAMQAAHVFPTSPHDCLDSASKSLGCSAHTSAHKSKLKLLLGLVSGLSLLCGRYYYNAEVQGPAPKAKSKAVHRAPKQDDKGPCLNPACRTTGVPCLLAHGNTQACCFSVALRCLSSLMCMFCQVIAFPRGQLTRNLPHCMCHHVADGQQLCADACLWRLAAALCHVQLTHAFLHYLFSFVFCWKAFMT